MASLKELLLEILHFTSSWEIASHQKPKDGFRQWLSSAWGCWAFLHYFKQVMASVVYPFCWVKFWSLIKHPHHSMHASNNLAYFNLSNLGISMLFLKLSKNLLLFCNMGFHLAFQSSWKHSSSNLYPLNKPYNSKLQEIIGPSSW